MHEMPGHNLINLSTILIVTKDNIKLFIFE